MIRKWIAFLILAFAAGTVFCQSGSFPLDDYQRAVEARDFAKVRYLIKKYRTNSEYVGESILYKAVETDDVELVKVLLEAGIPRQVYRQEWNGEYRASLYIDPVKNNHLEMAKLLTEYYIIEPDDVLTAIQYDNMDALNLFTQKGFDLRGIHELNLNIGMPGMTFTYFNAAVGFGKAELAARLLEEGHSVNIFDSFETSSAEPPILFSALDYAVMYKNETLRSWLLRNGAKTGLELLSGMSTEDMEQRFHPKNRYSYRTTVDNLECRMEPTLGAPAAGFIKYADVLYAVCSVFESERSSIEGFNDIWYYVLGDKGIRGWVYRGYLRPHEYKLGDVGGAGGVIFYDKGDYAGGWCYLQAAPRDLSVEAEWGGYEMEVGGTSTEIGSGMANTEAIVAALGPGDYAARLCYDLALRDGDYDDWFLPSRDELNLMYQQRERIGGFTSGPYWSSSEGGPYGAWHQYFDSGSQYFQGLGKPDQMRVRAVRAF